MTDTQVVVATPAPPVVTHKAEVGGQAIDVRSDMSHDQLVGVYAKAFGIEPPKPMTPAKTVARTNGATDLSELGTGPATAADFAKAVARAAPTGPAPRYSQEWAEPRDNKPGRTLTAEGVKVAQKTVDEFFEMLLPDQQEARAGYAEVLHGMFANEHGMVHYANWAHGSHWLYYYTLPKLIEDQHYPPDIVWELKWAREHGVSQEVLNAWIQRGMKERGFNV